MNLGCDNMLESLRQYLRHVLDDENIYLDNMPAAEKKLEAVGLFEWQNNISEINDGSSVHYIQIQVRRESYGLARSDCKKIFSLLDSGTEEKLIWLSEEVYCICRPRRGALLLERSSNYTVFYCEIALWGDN